MSKFEALSASMLLFFASACKEQQTSEPEATALQGLRAVTENEGPFDAGGLLLCDKDFENCMPEAQEPACTVKVCPPKPPSPSPR